MLQACPSLASPRYLPTLWAADTWTNCGLFVAKQIYDKSCLRRDKYTREVLVLEDGGTVSIDYAECPPEMPKTAPIVIFLHTITGSAKETGYFMRYAVKRGWRTCVFNRLARNLISVSFLNREGLFWANYEMLEQARPRRLAPDLSELQRDGGGERHGRPGGGGEEEVPGLLLPGHGRHFCWQWPAGHLLGEGKPCHGFLQLRSTTVCFRKGTTPLLWRLPPYALPTILLVLSGFHSHLDLV